MGYFSVLAIVAGAAIAVQASMNARLGMLLHSSLAGATIAFLFSGLLTFLFFMLSTRQLPQLEHIKVVPVYLWFSGGFFSAFGVVMFYYLIPKMGVGTTMSYALAGQILMATVFSHFGWFGLPIRSIDGIKVAGMGVFILGVVLLNWEAHSAH